MSKTKKAKIIIKCIIVLFIALGLGYHTYCHYMVSKFYKAIDEGNTEELIACIDKMPNFNLLDVCIPLSYIRHICLQGAADKGYPIYYAVWKEADISVMEALLEKGADPNKKEPYGLSTPFQYLCYHSSVNKDEKIELMVQYGADISSISLYIPAFFQDLKQEKKEETFNYISFLWEKGITDREHIDTKFERTVLHSASECLDTEYLNRLYHNENRGMDYLLNTKDVNGDTPIFYSVRRNYVGNCEFLINEGADINIKNNEGKTAYDVAVELGYEECINVLEPATR